MCNRLNLLLLDEQLWDAWLPEITAQLTGLGIKASLPPHDHPLGYEWALDSEREATVTIAPASGPAQAAAIANEQTSGLAAGIAAADAGAAEEFLAAYTGTGAFWNATTRLLDGFKLFEVPETGINLDAVPGPRGPVTFRDLSLRQFVVTPPSPVTLHVRCVWIFRCARAACVSILSMWWATTSRRCLRPPRAAAKISSRSCGAMRTPLSFATCAFSPRRAPRTSPRRPGSMWSAGCRGSSATRAAWRAWLFTTARRRTARSGQASRRRHPAEPLDEIALAEVPTAPDAAQLALDNLATESAIALLARLPRSRPM